MAQYTPLPGALNFMPQIPQASGQQGVPSWWNVPNPALGGPEQLGQTYDLLLASPFAALADRAATVGPEDQGKSQFRMLGEQFLGNLHNTPKNLAHLLVDPWAAAAKGGIQRAGEGLEWLASPVEIPGQPPIDFAIQGQEQGPPAGGGLSPAPGQVPGMSSITLPGMGTQGQAPQMPQVQRPQMANYGGFLEQLRGLAPSMEAPLEQVVDVPAPIAPDTSGQQNWLQKLEQLTPKGPDVEGRKTQSLVAILGAAAAGAARGDTFGQQIALAGGAAAGAYIQQAQQYAQEDKAFQREMLQYEGMKAQAQGDLAETQRQYQQAVQDTQTGNLQAHAEANNRAQRLGLQLQEQQRQWQVQLAEVQLKAQEAQARAFNQYTDQVLSQEMIKYKAQMDRSQPQFIGGNIVRLRKNDQGQDVLDVYDVGKETSGWQAMMKLSQTPGMQPLAQKNAERLANFSMGMQKGDPLVLQEVIADSILDEAPALLGKKFETTQAQIGEKAMQLGVFPGSAQYATFYQNELKKVLMEELQGGGIEQLGAAGNPWAKRYLELMSGGTP